MVSKLWWMMQIMHWRGLGFDGRLYQQNGCMNLALVYISLLDVLFWTKKVKYWSLSGSWHKLSYKVAVSFQLSEGEVTLAKLSVYCQ